ncbi:MAG: hypothetical protein JXB47_15355 [Anaerolineae bacterium]|nr:hypothetical protein [Anaerolineae bacterium]
MEPTLFLTIGIVVAIVVSSIAIYLSYQAQTVKVLPRSEPEPSIEVRGSGVIRASEQAPPPGETGGIPSPAKPDGASAEPDSAALAAGIYEKHLARISQVSEEVWSVLKYLESTAAPKDRFSGDIRLGVGLTRTEWAGTLKVLRREGLVEEHAEGWFNLTSIGRKFLHEAERKGDIIVVEGNVGAGAVIGSGSIRAGQIVGGNVSHTYFDDDYGDAGEETQPRLGSGRIQLWTREEEEEKPKGGISFWN